MVFITVSIKMFLPVETNAKTRNKDEKKLALLGSGLYITVINQYSLFTMKDMKRMKNKYIPGNQSSYSSWFEVGSILFMTVTQG